MWEGRRHYVMNGFYMAMRGNLRTFSHYSLLLGRVAHFLVGRTSGAKCWAPRTPPSFGVLRRAILTTGARSATGVPDTGDNGVHASASPFGRLGKSELVRASFETDAAAAASSRRASTPKP